MTEIPMLDQLEHFFADQLAASSPRIHSLVKTSTGRSRENWSFDLVRIEDGHEVVEPLILRRDPLGGLVDTDRAHEFAILKALETTAVPAPLGRWLDADGTWFGRPALIMRREPGDVDYHILSGALPLDQRVLLAEHFCDLLAQLHLVDWRGSQLADHFDDPGQEAALYQVEQWARTFHDDRRETYPEIELAIDWLRRSPPLAPATVVVHGDYKPGNILLEGTRIVALLDWELAHLGDPVEDLGWVTQPLRRREHIIPGRWEDDQLLDRYQQATGFAVDRNHVRWWNVFATFRTAVMQVSGLRAFLEGRSDEPYRPTSRVLRTLIDSVES